MTTKAVERVAEALGEQIETLAQQEQARLILDRVYYLPASKRKPEDTYWTLAGKNMVHTEFPDHQENVRRMAESKGFAVSDYCESISDRFPADVPDRLSTIMDFRKAYEANGELVRILQEAGISDDLGKGGLTPEEWPDLGPVQKTLAEFTAAYNTFRTEMLKLFKELT